MQNFKTLLKKRPVLSILFLFIAGLTAAFYKDTPVHNENKKDKWVQKEFDYYILALSYSPDYCFRKGLNTGTQCGTNKRYGFIVHGLWPQFNQGWPSFCQGIEKPLARNIINAMMPIMPDRGLIQHQWRKHGSCSNLSPENYFQKTQKAFQNITIPPEILQQNRQRTYSKNEFVKLWQKTNKSLKTEHMEIICRGKFISEIRICLAKNLDFKNCTTKKQDICPAKVNLR